jgi:hypothetical protein
MLRRCDRNRNRSKRRAIYCPVHGCYLDSVSKKYQLFADTAGQLQQRGLARHKALMLISSQTTVSLDGEWLEIFWCDGCQKTQCYHVHKTGGVYTLAIAPTELWQQVTGVIHPHGNPSVGEFTRRQSRMATYKEINEFRYIN